VGHTIVFLNNDLRPYIDRKIKFKGYVLKALKSNFILFQVQVPPEWAKLPGPVKGIEQEKVDFECLATGMPHPYYTWVDWEGKDATERDG
jgi:hypothetical protein